MGDRYFHEVFFRDVRVPTACRLGPENEGWAVVSYALQYERVGAARYARAARTLDALAERYVTPAREAELATIFREATRLEADFWEMGWTLR